MTATATSRAAPPVRATPAWTVVAALVPPVALIGGGLVAIALQPSPATAAWATISDLAARYARHREVMTAALGLTGAGLLTTAAGFATARVAGRVALAVAGVGVLVVAATPLPENQVHSVAALIALAALTAWPALGARPDGTGRRAAGVRAAGPATAIGAGLLVVLYLAPSLLGGFGVVEKVLAGGEVSWLAVVVVDARRGPR